MLGLPGGIISAERGSTMNRLGECVCRAAAVGAWCSAMLMSPGSATAGPPFRTDDPVPVDLGHYEFYTFSTGTVVSDDTSGVLPGFEFNYGLIPDGQFHIVASAAFDSPSGGPTKFGYGDTELGFKYRFIHEDDKGLEAASCHVSAPRTTDG
jgi:hypothetical protein